MFFSKHLISLLPGITVALYYDGLLFGTGVIGPFWAIVHGDVVSHSYLHHDCVFVITCVTVCTTKFLKKKK